MTAKVGLHFQPKFPSEYFFFYMGWNTAAKNLIVLFYLFTWCFNGYCSILPPATH